MYKFNVCVCVCVRVCVRACVHACVRACMRACVRVSVTYRRPNCWTDHDQIWHVYADRSGNGSYLKKLVPHMVRKSGLIMGHSSKRVFSWRAASNPSRGSEPLAKLREEL